MDELEQDKQLRESYIAFMKSPAGRDMYDHLSQLYERSIDDAVDSLDMPQKALLLQTASAYKIIRSYIERMTTL